MVLSKSFKRKWFQLFQPYFSKFRPIDVCIFNLVINRLRTWTLLRVYKLDNVVISSETLLFSQACAFELKHYLSLLFQSHSTHLKCRKFATILNHNHIHSTWNSQVLTENFHLLKPVKLLHKHTVPFNSSKCIEKKKQKDNIMITFIYSIFLPEWDIGILYNFTLSNKTVRGFIISHRSERQVTILDNGHCKYSLYLPSFFVDSSKT